MGSDVYNNEAEQFLLAAIIRHPERYYEIDTVGLDPTDFANKTHKVIFAGVLHAVSQKHDPAIPYVVEFIKQDGKDSVVEYINELSNIPSSVEQAVSYASVVKGLSVSRKLASAGASIIEIASQKRADYPSAIVDAHSILSDVESALPAQQESAGVADILTRMEASKPTDRIPVDFSPTLGAITGGIAKGHFWVIGGFSSTGKSAFACNMVLDMLRHRRSKVAIASAEMTQEQYVTRLLSILSGIPGRDISSRVTIGLEGINRLEDAKSRLREYNLTVYDNLYRMQQIRTEMQRLKMQSGLDVFILDYIQNVSITGDEVKDAREVALECQRMAKDLDIAVVAFSQVSNAQGQAAFDTNGEGDFYSFKGHGAIRDAADVAVMLQRSNQQQSSKLKVDVKKNRHGPISKFYCDFDLDTGTIREQQWEEI